MSREQKKPAELLTDLQDHIVAKLMNKTSITDDEAKSVAYDVVDAMCGHWGGQILYFPMGFNFKLSKRDEEIWAEFNGSNYSELAMKHRCSVQWIYTIVARMKRLDRDRRQPGLF